MPPFGELFLRHPDLFPARRAGEPWGERTVEVDFVGGPYRFHGINEAQARALLERFGPLATELGDSANGQADAVTEIAVFRVDASEFLAIDIEGWSYTFDRDYQPDAVRVAGLRFMARIDGLGSIDGPGSLVGTLFSPEADGPFFLSQVENFFRLLVAYRLLHLGGVLLHSAGVVSPRASDGAEVAHVFVGHSGAGKTTISRRALAEGRQVLSDDMNALCPGGPESGTGLVAEKLPFAGDLGRTPGPRQSYPLAGVHRLKKGANALRPLGRAEAVAFLLGCSPFVNVDPHRVDALTANLVRLCRHLRPSELTFSKEGGFWPLVDGEPQSRRDS